MAAKDDIVLQELHRASVLAGRPGVSLVSADAPRADRTTGSRARTAAAINRLARAGRLERARRDVLVLPDQTGRITVTLDALVHAVARPDYLITGGRALQRHDLTDQHHFTLVAVSARRHAPMTFHGETAKFYEVDERQLWGKAPPSSKASGDTQYARAERAVLDAINHPRFGVSLHEAVFALRRALGRDPRFPSKLARAAHRNGSAAAARRAGLLVERVAGPDAATPLRPLVGDSRTPIPLRPGGPTAGVIDARWRVLVNVEVAAPSEAA